LCLHHRFLLSRIYQCSQPFGGPTGSGRGTTKSPERDWTAFSDPCRVVISRDCRHLLRRWAYWIGECLHQYHTVLEYSGGRWYGMLRQSPSRPMVIPLFKEVVTLVREKPCSVGVLLSFYLGINPEEEYSRKELLYHPTLTE